MLVLRVLPPSGNPNNLFPYKGIWGLEPVSVSGRVGCTYDSRASGKPPLVKSVQVRLVRTEILKGKTVRERMAEATVWTPPEGTDAVEVGQVELPFELRLPADVRGMSSMTMFPTARVSYQVEASATLASGRKVTAESRNMHVARFSRVNMDPSSSGPISWSSSTMFDRVPPFEYSIQIPNQPFTPEDYLSVYISIHLPANAPAPVQLKGFELSAKRQIYLVSTGAPSGPVESTPFQYESEIATARTDRPSTRAARAVAKKAGEPDPFDSRTQTTMMMQVESTDPSPGLTQWDPRSFPMTLNPGETRSGVARLRMRERGFHAWSYGESGENDVFRVGFTLAAKFIVKKGRSSESFKLKPKPIHVCSAEDYPAMPRPLVVASSGTTMSGYEAFEPTWPKVAPSSCASSCRCSSTDRQSDHRVDSSSQDPYSAPSHRGRRLAENSEAVGAPARTRPRRDPPAPLRLHNAASSSRDSSGRRSDSSTIDTLGPITPNTLDTPGRPPSPSPSTRSSIRTTQSHPAYLTSPPSNSRCPSRLVRISHHRHRPRSIASGRASTVDSSSTSVSNISIVSYASVSSSGQSSSHYLESRRPRVRSASTTAIAGGVSTSSPSPSLSANTNGMHGLHLDEEEPRHAIPVDGLHVPCARDAHSRDTSPRSRCIALAPLGSMPQAPPSPESRTEGTLPPDGGDPVFRDPFSASLSPRGTRVVKSDGTAPSAVRPVPDHVRAAAEAAATARARSESSATISSGGGTGGGNPMLHDFLDGAAAGRRSSTPHILLSRTDAPRFERRASTSPSASVVSTRRKSSVGNLLANLFSRRNSKSS
ncbi:hypothetical protein JCM3774_003781 [Rhodotorula dairenensis]